MNWFKAPPILEPSAIRFYEEYVDSFPDIDYICKDYSQHIFENHESVNCSDLSPCERCPFSEKYVNDLDSYITEYKLKKLKL